MIPTAKIATLARVASPVSLARGAQDMIYQPLREYFGQSRRLMKQGDIVGLPVDGESSDFNDFVTMDEDVAQEVPQYQ